MVGHQESEATHSVSDLVESPADHESARGGDEVETLFDLGTSRRLENEPCARWILWTQLVSNGGRFRSSSEPENLFEHGGVVVVS